MIRLLDHSDRSVAASIHAILMAAYAVEAELLGAADFAPLRRTIDDVMQSPTKFLGVLRDGCLAGVVEIDEVSDPPNIDGLVVSPDAFRRGLGRELVTAALARLGTRTVTVSTGERNVPAIRLYESLGFRMSGRAIAPPDIPIVKMVRPG